MIESFARAKFDLYSRGSRFHCDEACPRYGCRGSLVVSAVLFEVLTQARVFGRQAADFFSFAYRLGTIPLDEDLSRVRIRITLRKPCVFLEDGRNCSMYRVRPAACALFPEHLALLPEARRKEYIENNGMGHYPCVADPGLGLSAEREEAIRRLWRMHQLEVLATEICLFGIAGFSVDLREDVIVLFDRERPRSQASPPGLRIPYGKIEEAMERHGERTGLFELIREKLASLEKETAMQSFFSALSIAEALTEASF